MKLLSTMITALAVRHSDRHPEQLPPPPGPPIPKSLPLMRSPEVRRAIQSADGILGWIRRGSDDMVAHMVECTISSLKQTGASDVATAPDAYGRALDFAYAARLWVANREEDPSEHTMETIARTIITELNRFPETRRAWTPAEATR